MLAEHQSGWRGDVSADRAPAVGFAWTPDREGEYVDRENDGFGYADLGLAGVSGGALGVSRLTVLDASAVGTWRQLANDFDFLFVIDGSLDVEGPDGTVTHLGRYSSALHPKGHRYRLTNPSADLDAVHITAPAELVHGDTATASYGPVYTHDSEDAYVVGAGPRPWFKYRDLGTSVLTEGRIHIHVVEATQPITEGTGWHYHTMAQWFMVLGGSARTQIVDRGDPLAVKFGDSQCLGEGEVNSHNATDISSDYRVIEMCLPAEYETFVVEAPASA